MSSTNNLPPQPGPSSSDADKVDAAEQKKRWPAVLVGVAIFAVIVIAAAWVLLAGGKDGDDEAPDTAVSAPNSAYVDDSGEQEHELEMAPGESDDVSEMQLAVGDEEPAPVDPIQVTDDGALIPPQDVSRLGWYSASAVPGDKGNVGSSVITGHVNFAGQGEGYAAKFVKLKKDDTITITVNGEERTFRVTQDPYHVTKGADFSDVMDDMDGENRVVLVTCGGEFVGGQLGYADNVLTIAEPV
ncbi:class F sortase [Corynebacterium sp. zg-331]|uniref:class F sortase n=1 Tax=unclassified Corynebacterium TaxID=2624378 RepID=UPI00128CF583|nr:MULTISPECIES: class F sortase [unclassified Corynebacterium]MBC3186682.1 class F sortase [Corynebacterium sp. zg-331]MPV53164.1 sortase [Corynebacterium sp. zg331]